MRGLSTFVLGLMGSVVDIQLRPLLLCVVLWFHDVFSHESLNKLHRLLQNKLMKMQLVGTMRSRSANLEKLQQIDIEKFNWLTKELQINIMPIVPPRLSKREIREKAARDAKEALIVQKTQELRKKLAKEKQKFDEYRQAELADIEQSLQELGIEMKSLEQTLTDLGASEHIPRLEPWMSLEQLLWQRRFAQLMELKRKTDAETLHNYGFIVPKSLLS